MKKWLALTAVFLLVGCGSQCEKSEKGESFKEGVDNVVEGVTGIAAVKAGKRAEDKLKAVNEDYNKKMNQALEENK